MKHPTYVLAKVTYFGKEEYIYQILNIKNSLACKWLLKNNICNIIIPNISNKEELEEVLPPFWGELRKTVYRLFFDMAYEFTPDLEILCSREAIFHKICLTIDYVPLEEFDEYTNFINMLDSMELKELLQIYKYIKPNATSDIIRFRDKIKYHFQWRRTLSSKEVCAFDNNRDNEDDEL